MKNLTLIAIALFLYSCGGTHNSVVQSANKTPKPKVYKMSQSEKDDVNFDLRENKKIVEANLQNKNIQQKEAAKRSAKLQKELNELNNKTSKKKDKRYVADSFNFYH